MQIYGFSLTFRPFLWLNKKKQPYFVDSPAKKLFVNTGQRNSFLMSRIGELFVSAPTNNSKL